MKDCPTKYIFLSRGETLKFGGLLSAGFMYEKCVLQLLMVLSILQ